MHNTESYSEFFYFKQCSNTRKKNL